MRNGGGDAGPASAGCCWKMMIKETVGAVHTHSLTTTRGLFFFFSPFFFLSRNLLSRPHRSLDGAAISCKWMGLACQAESEETRAVSHQLRSSQTNRSPNTRYLDEHEPHSVASYRSKGTYFLLLLLLFFKYFISKLRAQLTSDERCLELFFLFF